MMAGSSVQRTRRLLSEELADRGFERCDKSMFFAPQVRSNDAIGLVSVNTNVWRDGSHEIFPFVGVRNERFQRLIEQLDPETRRTRCHGSAGISLSSLMPGMTHWSLERDASEQEARAMCKEAVDAIQQYGFVKMRELLTPEGLVQDLHVENSDLVAGPIALLLAGDAVTAAMVVERERKRLEESPAESAGPWGRRYCAFAERFSDSLRSQPG